MLCWSLVFVSLLDYFLPLVVSFLLQFLEAAEVMIFDVLLFVFGEYNICKIWSINVNRFVTLGSHLKPWVLQGLLGCEPLPVIYLYQSANKVLGLIGNFFTLEIEAAFQYQLVQLFHGVTSERNCTEEHYVEADASAPHVGLETAIALLPNDFRRNICWRAALLIHFLLFRLELS